MFKQIKKDLDDKKATSIAEKKNDEISPMTNKEGGNNSTLLEELFDQYDPRSERKKRYAIVTFIGHESDGSNVIVDVIRLQDKIKSGQIKFRDRGKPDKPGEFRYLQKDTWLLGRFLKCSGMISLKQQIVFKIRESLFTF